MSRSMVLLKLGSVLMSITPVTTEDYVDAWVLGHHLRACWCLKVLLQPNPCRSEWHALPPRAMVRSRPKLLLPGAILAL